jgi:hypothetical protein
MNEENDKYDFTSWMKSGLGIGAISIGGYFLGFAYEKGYASYFGIPLPLIKLDLINIFLSVIALIGLLWFILWITNLGYMIFSAWSNVIYRSIVRSAPSLLVSLCLLLLYINTPTWQIVKWVAFVPLILLFLGFVWPLIEQRGKGTYPQKLEAQEQANKNVKAPKLFSLIAQKANTLNSRRLVNIAIILFVLYFLAYAVGESEAERQKKFWIVREPQQLVVLRIYGDRFVCAPFDFKAGTVEKTLYILDTPKQGGLWLEWQQVGPLKPADRTVSDENIPYLLPFVLVLIVLLLSG